MYYYPSKSPETGESGTLLGFVGPNGPINHWIFQWVSNLQSSNCLPMPMLTGQLPHSWMIHRQLLVNYGSRLTATIGVLHGLKPILYSVNRYSSSHPQQKYLVFHGFLTNRQWEIYPLLHHRWNHHGPLITSHWIPRNSPTNTPMLELLQKPIFMQLGEKCFKSHQITIFMLVKDG